MTRNKTKVLTAVVALVLMTLEASRLFAASPYLQQRDVRQVEEYLNGVKYMVADFTQISPYGDISTGKFYLARPINKLRWEYDPPVPILIIATDKKLYYYDIELNQVDEIRVEDTLASVLTRRDIKFEDDIEVIEYEKGSEIISITLRMKKSPKQGKLKMVFSENPTTLRKLEITNDNDEVTTVALENPIYLDNLEDKLFTLERENNR